MTVFLTSSPGGHFREEKENKEASGFSEENGFLERLRERWEGSPAVLIISAAPDDAEMNENVRADITGLCTGSGLRFSRADICDRRDMEAVKRLSEYGVLFLSGGHVPTQNAFFKELSLREALAGYEGIVIGISAGSMNSADIVYAQPELEGEAVDPSYKRFLGGLGLTNVMLLPHYQLTKDEVLDGKELFEEITLPDSIGEEFYAIPDGSYLLIEDGKQTMYGECFRIKDGDIEKFCENGESREISSMFHYEYWTWGTCSQIINFDLDGDKVHNIVFTGGCNGNLKAIAKLVEGMSVEEIAGTLAGNTCGDKPTSCADQLATALREAARERDSRKQKII